MFVGNMQGGDDDVTVAVPLQDGEYSNMLVGAGSTECRALQVKGGQAVVRGPCVVVAEHAKLVLSDSAELAVTWVNSTHY